MKTYYHCGDPTRTQPWAGSTLWLSTLCGLSTAEKFHWTAPRNYTSYPEVCTMDYEGELVGCPDCMAHPNFGMYILGEM